MVRGTSSCVEAMVGNQLLDAICADLLHHPALSVLLPATPSHNDHNRKRIPDSLPHRLDTSLPASSFKYRLSLPSIYPEAKVKLDQGRRPQYLFSQTPLRHMTCLENPFCQQASVRSGKSSSLSSVLMSSLLQTRTFTLDHNWRDSVVGRERRIGR
jgi:hypothetical protein